MRVVVPPTLEAFAARGAAWADWLEALPTRAGELLSEWRLAPDGPPTHGSRALVSPVRDADGVPRVLRIGFPDAESEHEHLALGRWGGRGAVALVRADPRRRALLLERLAPEDLGDLWDVEACEIVGKLYAALHVAAGPQLRTLPSSIARRAGALGRDARSVPVPRRLVEQCLALARDLCDDERSAGTLIHADLHYAHVLRSPERGWVAIDPEPLSGDPHYEPAPMLLRRFDEYGAVAGDSVRDGIRRRFHTLVDVAGLDEDRARAWAVVRCVLDAHARPADRDHVTRCLTVAKAVQD